MRNERPIRGVPAKTWTVFVGCVCGVRAKTGSDFVGCMCGAKRLSNERF